MKDTPKTRSVSLNDERIPDNWTAEGIGIIKDTVIIIASLEYSNPIC